MKIKQLLHTYETMKSPYNLFNPFDYLRLFFSAFFNMETFPNPQNRFETIIVILQAGVLIVGINTLIACLTACGGDCRIFLGGIILSLLFGIIVGIQEKDSMEGRVADGIVLSITLSIAIGIAVSIVSHNVVGIAIGTAFGLKCGQVEFNSKTEPSLNIPISIIIGVIVGILISIAIGLPLTCD